MPSTYRVGIVGLGVAGTTAAYLLARDGHRVTVLERSPVVGPVGAGVLLQTSGQAVLRQLGVLDAVTAHAAPIEFLHARHTDGRTLIRTRYDDYAPGCRAYGVHRGALFDALYDLLRTQPAEVRLGCAVVGREVDAGGGGVYLRDGCGGRHGPFDFVIAGDGARSALRDACGFRARVTRYGHGTLWMTAPSGGGARDHLLQVVRGNRNLLGLLPLGDGLTTLFWGLPVRDFAGLRTRGLDALKAEIRAFCPEAAGVLDYLCEFDQLILSSYQHVHLRRWHDRAGRTLCIGDAAHAMSPHLGQGINLAMVDAWRLAACVREAPDPAAAFAAFERRQRRHVRYYAAVTYLLAPFFQSDWRLLGWGRDLVLPWLPHVGPVRRQMLLTLTGLKGGFLAGPVQI